MNIKILFVYSISRVSKKYIQENSQLLYQSRWLHCRDVSLTFPFNLVGLLSPSFPSARFPLSLTYGNKFFRFDS